MCPHLGHLICSTHSWCVGKLMSPGIVLYCVIDVFPSSSKEDKSLLHFLQLVIFSPCLDRKDAGQFLVFFEGEVGCNG